MSKNKFCPFTKSDCRTDCALFDSDITRLHCVFQYLPSLHLYTQAISNNEDFMGLDIAEILRLLKPEKMPIPITLSFLCPSCKSFITKKSKNCPDCGQALDWGDTDDL